MIRVRPHRIGEIDHMDRRCLGLGVLVLLLSGCTSSSDPGSIRYLVDGMNYSETPPLSVTVTSTRTEIYAWDDGNRRSVEIEFPGHTTGTFTLPGEDLFCQVTVGPLDENGKINDDDFDNCWAGRFNVDEGTSCTITVNRYDDWIEGSVEAVVYCLGYDELHNFTGNFEVKAP